MDKQLSVEDGIKIQSEQLAGWERVLLPNVYAALEAWATEDNHHALMKSGYDVVRGQDLDSYVQNYMNHSKVEKFKPVSSFKFKFKLY